jgi:hypothetical protein
MVKQHWPSWRFRVSASGIVEERIFRHPADVEAGWFMTPEEARAAHTGDIAKPGAADKPKATRPRPRRSRTKRKRQPPRIG